MKRIFLNVLGLSVLALSACNEEHVKHYTVNKKVVTPAQMPDMSQMPMPSAQGEQGLPGNADAQMRNFIWDVPKYWTSKEASAMRIGSYTIVRDGVEGDLSVIRFPGNGGGLLANINRWRGQIGLAHVGVAELEEMSRVIQTGIGQGVVVNFQNDEGKGILGTCWFLPDQAVFAKLTAPGVLTQQVDAEFVKFSETFRFIDEQKVGQGAAQEVGK